MDASKRRYSKRSSPDDSAKGGMSGSRPNEMSVGRAHVIFSGTVQGVGFRYTAKNFAFNLRLTGWVKNLPDGRVEMVVEGTREKIENLLYKINKQFEMRIKNTDIDWMDAKKAFTGFDITY